jgi:hypothetical protein
MTRPFRRMPFQPIGLAVAPAVAPQDVTPEGLQSTVQALRGEWR